jgi:glucans biosynthesis protein C
MSRKHYIDWLRDLGILLLIPFHTSRIFDGFEPNYVKGAVSSLASFFISITSFWFMPLLFMLAGMSSFFAIQSRTAKEYMKERVLRLLMPFVFGVLLIIPPQGYFAMKDHFNYKGSYFEYLPKYFTDFTDLSGYFGTFTPAHLWFLLYLFVISFALLPFMLMISRKFHSSGNGDNQTFSFKDCIIYLMFIPITLLEATPSIGGKNIFFFSAFVLIGFILASPVFHGMPMHFRHLSLILATVSTISFFLLESALGFPQGITVESAMVAMTRNFAILSLLLTMLGYAEMYLNKAPRALGYMNVAAMPIYVLHQSVMMPVAYYILKVIPDAGAQFFAIAAGTLIISIGIFEVAKHWRFTRFILGIKSTKRMPINERV